MKKCCFAGHREVNEDRNLLHEKLKSKVEELIIKDNIREFWVGNYGAFDRIATLAIRELKERYSDILLVLVIPYLTNELREYRKQYNKEYDIIIIAEIPEKTPKKYYIIKTNEYMVDNSDCFICYIRHGWGGAARTLEYAEKKHISIIKL